MDFYALSRAVTNYHTSQTTAKVSNMLAPYKSITFNITYRGVAWTFDLAPLSIHARHNGMDEDDGDAVCSESWVVCACWLAVQRHWPDLYQQMIDVRYTRNIRAFTTELLKSLLFIRPYLAQYDIVYVLAATLLQSNTYLWVPTLAMMAVRWSSRKQNMAIWPSLLMTTKSSPFSVVPLHST